MLPTNEFINSQSPDSAALRGYFTKRHTCISVIQYNASSGHWCLVLRLAIEINGNFDALRWEQYLCSRFKPTTSRSEDEYIHATLQHLITPWDGFTSRTPLHKMTDQIMDWYFLYNHWKVWLFLIFQIVLIISGNLSFLNWLTIAPCLACFNDRHLQRLFSSRIMREVYDLQREPQGGNATRSRGMSIHLFDLFT